MLMVRLSFSASFWCSWQLSRPSARKVREQEFAIDGGFSLPVFRSQSFKRITAPFDSLMRSRSFDKRYRSIRITRSPARRDRMTR
jgi:hypothetical protein